MIVPEGQNTDKKIDYKPDCAVRYRTTEKIKFSFVQKPKFYIFA